MKTIYTLIAMMIVGSTTAQEVQKSKAFDQAFINDKKDLTGFEARIAPLGLPNNNRLINDTIIGTSSYDLQTNSSIANRCIHYSNGTNTSSFTYSNELASAHADRGTGYNFFNNGWAAQPTARIESERTGWSSLATTANDKEMFVSHTSNNQLIIASRPTVGNGGWTESYLPSNIPGGLLWPRMTSGGANGNTLHLIALSTPEANGGTAHKGFNGALLYFRSLDEGLTWDIIDSLLPMLDDSTLITGYRADSYSIVANGDEVGIAIFNQWGDSFIVRSSDNGDNWTATKYLDFPIDDYQTDQGSDFDNNGTFDTLFTTDEAGAAVIDDNGIMHIFYGNMRVLDSDTTDGNTSYFPGTSGLMYWNENMALGNASLIADLEDADNSGTIDFVGYALYYISLTGQPSVGTNADGSIFVTYAGYKENYFTGTQNYRHIYALKSMDGGASWNVPVDITPDVVFDGYEAVFATVAPMVDDKLRFWYHRDFEPGLSSRGDLDPIIPGEIIFVEVDTILGEGVGVEDIIENKDHFKLFPNPTTGQLTIDLDLHQAGEINVSISDIHGRIVGNKQMFNATKTFTNTFSVNHLSSGLYHFIIETKTGRLTQQFSVTD